VIPSILFIVCVLSIGLVALAGLRLVRPTITHAMRHGEPLPDLFELVSLSAFESGRCDLGESMEGWILNPGAWSRAARMKCFDAAHSPIAERIREEDCPKRDAFDGEPIVPLYRVTPIYPSVELDAGEEGRVLIEYVVDALGNVTYAQVIVSEGGRSGGAFFADAARHAVEKWMFCVDPAYEAEDLEPRRVAIPFKIGEQPSS
jgi:TonB family protein